LGHGLPHLLELEDLLLEDLHPLLVFPDELL
jgi:hypothetical protein